MGRDCSETSASIRIVARRMKLPNFGWMTLRWMPILPSPAATATGLWRDDPDLAGEAVHLHREAHRRVDRPDALRFQGGDDGVGHLVGVVARVVELQVGDRTGRAADRLAVHPADDADERLRPRVKAEDLASLVVEFGPVDRDEAHIVSPGVETLLARSQSASRTVGGRSCTSRRCFITVGWSSSFVTSPSSLYIQQNESNGSIGALSSV